MEQRAYKLRPRKDDSDTIQRRSKFARLQNQRRNKRKEAKTLRQEEIKSAYEQFARNNLWRKPEELPKTSDNDSEDISKRSTLFFSSPIILILNTVTNYALSFTPCS